MTVINDLTFTNLTKGAHRPDSGQACLLEATAYVAGEPWSDHPKCVSPVLAAYGRNLNDALPDDQRQQLLPYVIRLIGTAGDPAADQRRSYLALDLADPHLPASVAAARPSAGVRRGRDRWARSCG